MEQRHPPRDDAFIEHQRDHLSPEMRREKEGLLEFPVKDIDLEEAASAADLVDAFAGASIQARNVGLCARVYETMLTDPARPTVYLGLAGPLIAAGLRKVIRDLVAAGMVDVIVSTGAILFQDFYRSRGHCHFRGDPDRADDARFAELMVDRIYDTYVDEEKFWECDCWIARFADELEPGRYSTRAFLEALGRTIDDSRSILATAARMGVPVFCPAIADSSIGIGLTNHYRRCAMENRDGVVIDTIRDNFEITQTLVKSPATAAAYIAGGVPKNYINDTVVMSYVFNHDTPGHRYAFQLTADVPHWGGLSGSTLKEATSWGKIDSAATHAMAFVEPSVSFPLVAAYVLGRQAARQRPRLRFSWKGDRLESLEECNENPE